MSPSSTLITGVATLLLAMGIGVLIGRSGTASAQRTTGSPPVHVTVNGGGGAAGPTANAATATKKTHRSTKAHKSSAKQSTTATTTATTVTSQAAPPPTVTIGAKGSGAGYQNGHFTGNFFGP
jgi:hypothetical protein